MSEKPDLTVLVNDVRHAVGVLMPLVLNQLPVERMRMVDQAMQHGGALELRIRPANPKAGTPESIVVVLCGIGEDVVEITRLDPSEG